MKTCFTKDDLIKLKENATGICLSIYMPTPNLNNSKENYIKFKNKLAETEKQLLMVSLTKEQTKEISGMILQYFRDTAAAEKFSKSLAVFYSNGKVYGFPLPMPVAEKVEISDEFYTKPLEDFLTTHYHKYYILSLSQNDIVLYQATPYEITPIPLPNIPTSLKDFLKSDEFNQNLQYHTKTPKSMTSRNAIFFSSGDKKSEDKKNQLQRYFSIVNDAISEKLNKKKDPLVLIGAEYLFPIYKKVNSYPYLLRRGVKGSPERMKKETIHKETLKLVSL